MPSVLFVCTGNLYRSPLSEAFFRAHLNAHQQTGWLVDSAGTWTQPGQPMPSAVIRAAAKFGASIEAHRSQLVDADLLSRFDLILVMERGHKEALDQEFPFISFRTHLLSLVVDHLSYDIPDPLISGQDVDALAADLHQLIEKGYRSILELASSLKSSKQ